MKPYVYGVDIGGTAIKIGLFDADGTLLNRWTLDTRIESGGQQILPALAHWIEKQPIALDQVTGVGVGVPGPVRKDGVVEGCVNLGWGVVPVAQTLSHLLGGLPTRVINDANAAALGELWQGAGCGCSNLILVTLGTGIGSGIVADGAVLSGTHGAAGEIGHLQVNPLETVRCRCGKRGCLEQYASATGILRLAHQRGWTDASTAKEVLDTARGGNLLARSVTKEAGSWLGLALSYVGCVVDPERILFGGGVAQAGEILFRPVREQYRRSVFPGAAETSFALAALGNDAGIYGAAQLVLQARQS